MPAATPDTKIYKYHVENLRSIEIALQNTAVSARKAISEENTPATASFTRLYSFLLGAWAETRLKKLLYENNGYSPQERQSVLNQGTQYDQWQKAIEVAIRKHYRVPKAKLTIKTLPFTAFAQYSSLCNLLDDDLKSIIEVRNKLAHGQWIYPFNSDNTGIETDKFKLINKENILSLQFKYALIEELAEIIHDLAVSLPTFKRDFDIHYKKIEGTKCNLNKREYDSYKKGLIDKRKRGVIKRKSNKGTP